MINLLTPGTFCKKCVFSTFWWLLVWISANLALLQSKTCLQHSSLPFLPPASRFSTLWFGHAQKSKFWQEIWSDFAPSFSLNFLSIFCISKAPFRLSLWSGHQKWKKCQGSSRAVTGVNGLKCHYDENRIFSIKAILKHKQVACMREKMLLIIFKYLFVPEIFKFLKYANEPSEDVIYSTKFWSSIMKKDISANLHQKYLILCNKILN